MNGTARQRVTLLWGGRSSSTHSSPQNTSSARQHSTQRELHSRSTSDFSFHLLQRGSSTSSAMEGVVNAPLVTLNSHAFFSHPVLIQYSSISFRIKSPVLCISPPIVVREAEGDCGPYWNLNEIATIRFRCSTSTDVGSVPALVWPLRYW